MPVTRNAWCPGTFAALASPPDLLRGIDAFCAKHGMTGARFGRLSMDDPGFVAELRARRRNPRGQTLARIEAFMDGYEGGKA